MSEAGGEAGAPAAAPPERALPPTETGGQPAVSGLSDQAVGKSNDAANSGKGENVLQGPEPGKTASAVSSADYLPGSEEQRDHATDSKEDVRRNRLEEWQRTDLGGLREMSSRWNDATIKEYRARSAEQKRLAGG